MQPYTTLDLIALALAAIHFGAPLTYYYYLKTRYLHKPWNLKLSPNYQPKVTIIIPTYNEASLIKEKLDNILTQDYPREKIELIIIDSASTDGTPEKIKEWIRQHPQINTKLIQEQERRGKAHALNKALQHATGEITIITDADAHWPSPNTLRETVKWHSNPSIGAVSCLKQPENKGPGEVESGYRQYYNQVRLAESKAHSTPIFHGELAAYKTSLLKQIGGFPTDIGADDSHTATQIALQGHRAITPENIHCTEKIPPTQYHQWRIRRAQHLIQHFTKTLKQKTKPPKPLKTILTTETYLHLINPWTLTIATLLLATSTLLQKSTLATILLAATPLLLTAKPARTWITTQAYLTIAAIRNLWTEELTWQKQQK